MGTRQVPGKLPNDLGEGNAHEWISTDKGNDDAFKVPQGLCFCPQDRGACGAVEPQSALYIL